MSIGVKIIINILAIIVVVAVGLFIWNDLTGTSGEDAHVAEEEIKDVQREIELLQYDLKNIQNEIDEMTISLAGKQGQVIGRVDVIQELGYIHRDNLGQMVAQRDGLIRELERQEEMLANAEASNQEDVEVILRQIREKQAAIDASEHRINIIEVELRRARELLDEHTQPYRAVVADLVFNHNQLRDQVEYYRSGVLISEEQVSQLERRINELDNNAAELSRRIDSIDTEVEGLRLERARVRAEIATLQSNIDNANVELSELQRR